MARKKQPTPVKAQTVQWSKSRGDNKPERRWMARKCERERDKRAGGKVRQQEPRAPSHYDSSSSCVSPGVDCKPQSPRPDRETGGGTAEDRCESGCTWRGGLQQRGPAREAKTWSGRLQTSLLPFQRPQYPSWHPYQPGQPRSKRIEMKSRWGGSPNCPWAVCNQRNRQIQSGLQILPSTEIRLLSNDCKNDAQLRRGSALNLNSCFNLSMPPVLSVPAEKETSTCCQHK